jgi:TRAP-type mannitol/chloroaromatic compound transport system substrate-binding protein
MVRRAFVGAASGSASATPALAQTQNPEIRCRFPSSFPRNLDVLFGSCEQLGRRVAQLTDNRFRITPFPAGEIVPALQVLDAVQAGTVECGHTPALFYVGKEPALAFLPFGDTGTQMGGWFRREIRSMQELQGLKFRVAGFAGNVFERMGVIPTQIAPGDIYPSLSGA